MVKCKNYQSLHEKGYHADGCFILRPDERWVLHNLNLLLLQHHDATSDDIKFLSWWCYQRMHF